MKSTNRLATVATSCLLLLTAFAESRNLHRHERTAEVLLFDKNPSPMEVDHRRSATGAVFATPIDEDADSVVGAVYLSQGLADTGKVLVRRKRNFIHDIGRGVRRVASSLTGGRVGGPGNGPHFDDYDVGFGSNNNYYSGGGAQGGTRGRVGGNGYYFNDYGSPSSYSRRPVAIYRAGGGGAGYGGLSGGGGRGRGGGGGGYRSRNRYRTREPYGLGAISGAGDSGEEAAFIGDDNVDYYD